MSISAARIDKARLALDAHVREMITWHFSEETGCDFWLNWKRGALWDPLQEVKGFDDLIRFPHFRDAWLRDVPNEDWVPRPYRDKPFKVFETGGTTGAPKQRIAWEDHLRDFDTFSTYLDDAYFPPGGKWLMLGPTGPRRLRLAIEYLANIRGGACYFVDLDPRFIKLLLRNGDRDTANQYVHHVIEQAMPVLKHRSISCLYTTPRLLEALGERCDVVQHGITGVVCGGTSLPPQNARFLQEEVLENKGHLVPVYGNTLMGIACSEPLHACRYYDVVYHAPQPRAVLRIVDPGNPDAEVDYGERGRVELTTLTKETFIPRFLERDSAVRRPPGERWPWDGVSGVQPFEVAGAAPLVEGVY